MSLQMRDIYEEHLDEASFLWVQWERALVAPDYGLEETATLEERLLAHLDGLVVGGEPVARELLLPALDSEDPPRISAALWALLAEPGCMELAELVKRVRAVAPEGPLAALRRALELNGRPEVGEALLPLMKGKEAPLQAWATEVLASRGQLPRGVEVELLGHPDARVVEAVLRGMPPLPRDVASRELPRLLVDARPEVREAAIRAGMMSGVRAAWEACRKAVDARTKVDRTSLVLLALGGDERDLERLLACMGVEAMREDVLWALGFSGRVEAAEACLELMGPGPVAALAGEAFSAITGLKLEGAYVVPKEEEEPLPSLEEDLEQNLEPRPEDALPVPAREAVAAWWTERRKDFARGTRYLRGRAFSLEGLLEELERGPMRRRHVLALELALRSQGTCQLQTRAFTQRQLAGLERAREMRGRLSASPFPRMLGG
ncbi:TIGR02270 family protein [Archangium sp.]|uniref:TIGR02270 family protein n=1 Tax=Archangium sp. TaxID=1872627 RepID=UPI002D450052|nr:TIGR02270 family protein [Archangium sp.]HYO56216.1 TIGR02270 family protein [Archangium sp.]